MSARQTGATDFDALILLQVVRGWAIMFCLLPPTHLALGQLDAARSTCAAASPTGYGSWISSRLG